MVNLMRQAMLRNAIDKCEATFGGAGWHARHLTAILPKDFFRDPESGEPYSDDSIADEISAAMAEEPQAEAPEDDPAELRFNPVTGGTIAQVPKPTPATQPEPPKAAPPDSDRLVLAAKAANLSRVEAMHARNALAQARANLTAARAALAQGSPNPATFESNVRDYLKAQVIEREARARGEPWAIKKTRQGRGSYLDIAASYARGSDDPNAAARGRNRYGHTRGAFPASRLGTENFDPSRGPVRKVPQ